MDATPQDAATIGDHLPWTVLNLDYTEKLADIIPADLLDWRPVDPSGKFCFSLVEILMHVADARLMFVRQLTGDDSKEGYWATSEGPNEEGVWEFASCDGKQTILDSLRASREQIEHWLAKPATELMAVTDGAQVTFERHLEYFRERDLDTVDYERRGAPSIMRVMVAITAHESGHRGALQTLLRLKGCNFKSGD